MLNHIDQNKGKSSNGFFRPQSGQHNPSLQGVGNNHINELNQMNQVNQPQYTNFNAPGNFKDNSQRQRKKSSFDMKIPSIKLGTNSLLTILIFLHVMVLGTLVYAINPVGIWNQYQDRRLVGKVEGLLDMKFQDDVTIAEVRDAELLRSENEIQAEVYKDVQNGDKIVVDSQTMAIYRQSERKIIYNGDAPGTIVQKATQEIVDKLDGVVKSRGILSKDNDSVPQLELVQDPGILRSQNEEFYRLAQKNDLIAIYPQDQLIVLYRPSDEKVLNYGRFNTQIENSNITP